MLRRSVTIGIVVLAVLAWSRLSDDEGCRDDVADAAGIRLTYEAQGSPSAAQVRAAADDLCARVEGLGDERPAVAIEDGRIVVVMPKGTPDGLIDFVGAPGRLAFYDWEPVLLDEECRADANVNFIDRSPIVGRARATKLARKCEARLVRQERSQPSAPEPDAWWIVRGEPVLDGDDIVDPVQDLDPQTHEPIVAMEFTDEGRRRFAEVTRGVAERGADNALPGVPANQGAHHFAITLDDELVSTPFIDYAENPDGIDGETGVQISGGFTEDSARVLARLLELGPLPVELELVDRRDQG